MVAASASVDSSSTGHNAPTRAHRAPHPAPQHTHTHTHTIEHERRTRLTYLLRHVSASVLSPNLPVDTRFVHDPARLASRRLLPSNRRTVLRPLWIVRWRPRTSARCASSRESADSDAEMP